MYVYAYVYVYMCVGQKQFTNRKTTIDTMCVCEYVVHHCVEYGGAVDGMKIRAESATSDSSLQRELGGRRTAIDPKK